LYSAYIQKAQFHGRLRVNGQNGAKGEERGKSKLIYVVAEKLA